MEYQLSKLANRIGVELSWRDAAKSYHYDGNSIALQSKGIKIANTRVLHEILHFAVASERQREIPNYGLGKSSYDNQDTVSPIIMSFDDTQSQEFLVVMLTKCCQNVIPYNFGAGVDRWLETHPELVLKNSKKYFEIILNYRLDSCWW